MKKRVRWIGVTLLAAPLVVGSSLALAACVTGPGELGLEDGRLRACPSSPNCVRSEPGSGDHFIEPLRFEGSAEQAWMRLRELVEATPQTTIERDSDGYMHVVFVVSIFRFRDDVEFRLDDAGSVIHVRSASRVGYSDLGANRERIEALRERWGSAAAR